MEPQNIETCIRCGGYVETINELPGARCPHCGVRLDVTESITFDEQEEARALGCRTGPLLTGESAEIVDGGWHVVNKHGESHKAWPPTAFDLDRLLGFIYRTAATVPNPEGRKL